MQYALRTEKVSRFVRWYAGLTSGALLVVSVYAMSIGWIGLRTWVM